MPNGHFSGSSVHFPPTCELKKIYFWGRKISPPPPNLLRRSASRAASLERDRAPLTSADRIDPTFLIGREIRRHHRSRSKFPEVSCKLKLLPGWGVLSLSFPSFVLAILYYLDPLYSILGPTSTNCLDLDSLRAFRLKRNDDTVNRVVSEDGAHLNLSFSGPSTAGDPYHCSTMTI